MRCARCNAPLDDGVMVCSQCGAVVGMSYGPARASSVHKPAMAPPHAPSPGAAQPGAVKGLVARAKDLLRSPRAEWSAIATEPASAFDVWMGYVVPLALVGPVALAIAQAAFGTSYPLIGVVKAAFVTALAAGLLAFAFTLAQVALLAWAVDQLAPRFGAVRNRRDALRVVAYSMTPVWLAGALYLVPPLMFLWVFAAIYAFVLALFGLRTLMRCAPAQALAYALVTLGIAYALWFAAGAIVTALMGFGPVMLD